MVVLNAQDERCVAMAGRVPDGCEVMLVSTDPAQADYARHVQGGGRGMHLQHDRLVLVQGAQRVVVAELRRLPFTLDGRARHNVENALAACATLIGLGIAPERVGPALSTFGLGVVHNPLRLNVFRAHGVMLFVDYAHNAAAYRALADTVRRLVPGRLIGVVTAPGDRRDDDLADIGRVCAGGFDELVLYELDEWRGRLRRGQRDRIGQRDRSRAGLRSR